MKGISQVFVSHWPPLRERRDYLENALRRYHIEAQWVTEFDRRVLTHDQIRAYYSDDFYLFTERARLGGAFQSPPSFSRLTMAEIANAITHIEIYRQIAKAKLDVAMILEDDVILAEGFAEKLKSYMDQLPPDWDCFYVGSGCNLHLQQTDPNKNVYFHPRRESRTADIYLLTWRAAEKILKTIVPFAMPIDWELNYHQDFHKLNVYWAEPSIASQGSETNAYKSSVDRTSLERQ